MADNFNSTAQQLLDDSLWLSTDATEEDRKKKRHYSLRKALVQDVIAGAREFAEQRGVDESEFEGFAHNGISIVDDLRYAVLPQQSGTPADWNFWLHERDPLQLILKDRTRYMAKDTIEACASNYLSLPYRAPLLERTLVDVLVALEMYAFGAETLSPPLKSPWPLRSPTRSPFHQKHAFFAYLSMNCWNALTLLGLAYISFTFFPSFIGQRITTWLAAILVGLFLITFLVSTLFLPYNWRQQSKARTKIRTMLSMMIQTYSELGSEGVLSTRRIREVVSKAADAGVVWPGPLYAILDDNMSRTGRL